MTEWVEQRICSKFCIKLDHSSVETILMIQKAAAMANWWLHHNNVPTHALHPLQSFFVKHQNTQVTQPHYSPDLVSWDFCLFPKLKPPLKRKRFQTIDEIQENTMGQLMASYWENCVRSPGASFEGGWGIIVLCTTLLISCIFFNKCLYFSYYMAGYLLDRSYTFERSYLVTSRLGKLKTKT